MRQMFARSFRRGALRALALAGLSAAAFLGPRAAQAQDKITYYTWDGYELPAFHQAYLKEHPEGLNISVFGDDDEAFAKVRAGFHPDIAHPCVDKLPQWRKAGLLQPIDTKRIPNWDKIYPIFRQMPGVMADGKVWMVPWDWGNTSILYRTDLVKNPEASWNLLWDKQYAGKLAVIDAIHDTWIVGAIMAGVDPFDENADDIKKVAAKLREQRPLIRMYTTDMTSVEQALASGELVAAMTWNASYVDLTKQHVPVAFMHPKEKMLTWACGMVVLKGAHDLDKVYDFINARLADDAGEALVTNYAYGTANAEAYAKVPADVKAKFALPADPATELKNTVFTSAMKNPQAIAAAYARVKEGG
ncbi:extracellular solute-binding protein [Acidisoma sp. 7E03]